MVIILDEKQMQPPPPYYASSPSSPNSEAETEPVPPFPGSHFPPIQRPPANFETLPPHLLLHIVNLTMVPRKGRAGPGGQEALVEYKRKVLYWMTVCARLVNRSMYIACMHVLRSTYLPAYLSMIKPPYTSDPFPLLTPGSGLGSAGIIASSSTMLFPVNSVQRETQVLDMFLAAKVREDVLADESELHLEREEAFQDLFSVLQPRARLEDLVRTYGVTAGVISVSSSTGTAIVASAPCPSPTPSSTPSPSSSSFPPSQLESTTTSITPSPNTPSFPPTFPHPFPRPLHAPSRTQRQRRRIPFTALTCSFGSRTAGLVLTSKTGRRTIVEVPARAREEKLEEVARRLVRGLETWAWARDGESS